MSAALLDVNVLVALFDPVHVHHDDAHEWFRANAKRKWATCPLTINGCVRILAQSSTSELKLTPVAAAKQLSEFCEDPHHEFWPDDLFLLDEARFKLEKLSSPKQITDVYLLGIAVARGGLLVTFDRSIQLGAVVGASSSHLRILGAPPH